MMHEIIHTMKTYRNALTVNNKTQNRILFPFTPKQKKKTNGNEWIGVHSSKKFGFSSTRNNIPKIQYILMVYAFRVYYKQKKEFWKSKGIILFKNSGLFEKNRLFM